MITRRDFLKAGATASLLLLLPIGKLLKAATVEAEFKGRVYRGTSDGKIYVSDDQSKTWSQHMNFGEESSVSRIFTEADDNLRAQVEYRGNPFYLSLSPNELDWLVV